MKEYQTAEVKDLAAALANVHATMEAAKKDTLNPHFKSHYADIRAVVEVSRKLLSSNDLVVTQVVDYEGENVFIITQLTHKTGQWMRSWYPVRPIKSDPQSLGSAITYARRYAYCALVGVVADDDDDGNEGSNGKKEPKGEFETPELRKQFVKNCVDAIQRAESGAAIKDQRSLNQEKWDAMKASPIEADRAGFGAISEAYNTAVAALVKQAAEKAKPKTVEAAKSPGDLLGEDAIPF